MNTKENEIDMMLECATKIKKHLIRVLDEKEETSLKMKLNYVDKIMLEADSLKKQISTCS